MNGTFEEFDLKIDTVNPLKMEEYSKKLELLREKTGLDEAVKCGTRKNFWRKSCNLRNGWQFPNG